VDQNSWCKYVHTLMEELLWLAKQQPPKFVQFPTYLSIALKGSNWHVHYPPWNLWNCGLQDQTWTSLGSIFSTWHIMLLWIHIACHKLQWWTLYNTLVHKHGMPWWSILEHVWHEQTLTNNFANHLQATCTSPNQHHLLVHRMTF
jgi:hypothetical protein